MQEKKYYIKFTLLVSASDGKVPVWCQHTSRRKVVMCRVCDG